MCASRDLVSLLHETSHIRGDWGLALEINLLQFMHPAYFAEYRALLKLWQRLVFKPQTSVPDTGELARGLEKASLYISEQRKLCVKGISVRINLNVN